MFDARILICCFVFLSFNRFVNGRHFASFIKPCKTDDPNFKACCMETAKAAIPRILKGDPELKIPPCAPFHLPRLELEPMPGMTMKLIDIYYHGLEMAELQEFEVDSENKHFSMKVFHPKAVTKFDYEISGKLLSFALEGKGPGVVTEEDAISNIRAESEHFERDGKEYFNFTSLDLDVEHIPGKVHYQLDNLFNGNRMLGDSFNNLLNENPKEVEIFTKSPVIHVMRGIVMILLRALFKGVPLDEIFLK
ncbi:hypothetical protein JTB14_009716 [Gonioctena quinquepunctata]|nr:hypothetical protein JTB14_009716 [Gonioctena quinquepunctata]